MSPTAPDPSPGVILHVGSDGGADVPAIAEALAAATGAVYLSARGPSSGRAWPKTRLASGAVVNRDLDRQAAAIAATGRTVVIDGPLPPGEPAPVARPDDITMPGSVITVAFRSEDPDRTDPAGVLEPRTLELDATRWSTEDVTEMLAPLLDGRVPPSAAMELVSWHSRLDGLAASFEGLPGNGLPTDVTALRTGLAGQLRHDRATPWIWDAWGTSAVTDANAGLASVTDRALAWMNTVESGAGGDRVQPGAPTAGRGLIHHAGVLHTYGYLCSRIRTPFGWKRSRWVNGDIAAAAGVPRELLSPAPPTGTLLANATRLAATLVGLDAVDLRTPPPGSRPSARLVGRVIEIATHEERADGVHPLEDPLEVRTALFRRDAPVRTRAPNLLVYSLVEKGIERLVTLFAVDDATVEQLLASPDPDDANQQIRLRYNARIAGAGVAFSGRRTTSRF